MDVPSHTEAAHVVTLRERLDDLARRRDAALARPSTAECAVRLQQLEAMRFELAEVEWHLAQLEAQLTH